MNKIAVDKERIIDHIAALEYNVQRMNTFMSRLEKKMKDVGKFKNMLHKEIKSDPETNNSFMEACNEVSEELYLLAKTSDETWTFQGNFEDTFFDIKEQG